MNRKNGLGGIDLSLDLYKVEKTDTTFSKHVGSYDIPYEDIKLFEEYKPIWDFYTSINMYRDCWCEGIRDEYTLSDKDQDYDYFVVISLEREDDGFPWDNSFFVVDDERKQFEGFRGSRGWTVVKRVENVVKVCISGSDECGRDCAENENYCTDIREKYRLAGENKKLADLLVEKDLEISKLREELRSVEVRITG